ncbi:galactose-binding like protein [Pseudovirgaria hyperparasitica]|uniref:rhamnogalacturonan endolyase n=1 Tax=Pseudovirgaria hyperparasitica TaxID=470096 RepID=A0A6A6WE32_9PEZI|nr:galactose-binding like protein [Pseudovirgaria hyperparasitica]KAF2759827.1 galactose-binding like protein [Pseudovirgaria hyperparasitica]
MIQDLVVATPFLEHVGNGSWIFGNGLWNITQGPIYATKLHYDGSDAIGAAVGHYAGYDGENNLQWQSASIVTQTDEYIDISFLAAEGELHWVIFDGLAGSYQYFVNHALPDISIFRTLFRLDPIRFTSGRTYLKDEPLPDFSMYANATKVQDETWQLANGSFITKYDWSNYVRERDFNGVYGHETGSWYIHPSTDYFSGNHLSQTLTVHRESSTGDTVQLNVVQDTSHFQIGVTTAQPKGKIWGPWLWYLNNGSITDAARQQKEELSKWPYHWLNDTSYQSRGSLTGSLRLSDDRPASGAAVFLGDTDTSVRPLAQGSNYYYSTYADDLGYFSIPNIRTGTYGLLAWSNGDVLGGVYTNFTRSDIVISSKEETALGDLNWVIPSTHTSIFQIGDFDKKAIGFKNGGAPYQHGLAALSPANLTYTVGKSNSKDWYYAQSNLGTWDVVFAIKPADRVSVRTALLTLSLAGYSQSAGMTILLNDDMILGVLGKENITSDPTLYRSGTTSGEWHLFQYEIAVALLHDGENKLSFRIDRYTLWRGFLWDSIILEWV